MTKSVPYGMIMDLPYDEFKEIEKSDSCRDEAIFKYIPAFREGLKEQMDKNGYTKYDFGNIDFFEDKGMAKMTVFVRVS